VQLVKMLYFQKIWAVSSFLNINIIFPLGNSEVVPVPKYHNIKVRAYGHGGKAPYILNLGLGWR